VTLVIDKFSQKVAKKNEDSITNGVVSSSDTLPETFWTSVYIGVANPNYGSWREDKPEEETCD
jgi:hypothetical protein